MYREESGSLEAWQRYILFGCNGKYQIHAFKETGGLRRRHVTPGVSLIAPFPTWRTQTYTKCSADNLMPTQIPPMGY